jgi:hypothetical protein
MGCARGDNGYDQPQHDTHRLSDLYRYHDKPCPVWR